MKLPFHVNLEGKVAVVTGGSGVLGKTICHALAKSGAHVVVLARDMEKIESLVDEMKADGLLASGYSVDVLNKERLKEVHDEIVSEVGRCDILINGAGGNHPDATTSDEFYEKVENEDVKTFFDLDDGAIDHLFKVNYLGTLLPTQVFATDMIEKDDAVIINISSMNAFKPLTKIPAYSGAKAAISNFTEWLAVYFSKVNIRVNAIAPGFFLTEQNKGLLIEGDGEYSERANKIISQTPMSRFGEPEELIGTLLWLVDHRASSFVNGIVVPVDGGFSAYSGV